MYINATSHFQWKWWCVPDRTGPGQAKPGRHFIFGDRIVSVCRWRICEKIYVEMDFVDGEWNRLWTSAAAPSSPAKNNNTNKKVTRTKVCARLHGKLAHSDKRKMVLNLLLQETKNSNNDDHERKMKESTHEGIPLSSIHRTQVWRMPSAPRLELKTRRVGRFGCVIVNYIEHWL